MTRKLRALALAGCLIAPTLAGQAAPATADDAAPDPAPKVRPKIPAQDAAQDAVEPSDAYRAEIVRFLELANITPVLDEQMPQMWDQQKAAIRAEVLGRVEQEGRRLDEAALDQWLSRLGAAFMIEFKKDMPDMAALYTALYADRFSLAELKYLNWLYSRPTMKKFTRLQPEILAESGPALSALGADAGEQAMMRAFQIMQEGEPPPADSPR